MRGAQTTLRPARATSATTRPWRVMALLAAVLFLSLIAGYVATHSLRLSVFCVALAFLPLLNKRNTLYLAVVVVIFLGLIRRLLSPGRIDYDPLLLLPLLLIALAIVLPDARRASKIQIYRSMDGASILVLVTGIGLAAAQLLAPWTGVAGLYATVVQGLAFLIILLTSRGHIANIWPTLRRFIPWVGTIAATYGVYQFYVLPSWDRNWMVASQLQSVGQPVPRLVRVFGASESPGPFSVVLSIALLVAVGEFVARRQLGSRLVLLGQVAVIAFALVLTGVRTSLLATALALALVALASRNLKMIGLVVVACFALFSATGRIVGGEAASGSSILTSERFSISGLSQDSSVEARLRLLDLIGPGFRQPLGQGRAGTGAIAGGYDNTFVDLLVAYGPIVALGATALLVVLLGRALRWIWTTRAQVDLALPAVTIYLVTSSLAGNLFLSTTGLLGAYFLGLMLRVDADRRLLLLSEEAPQQDLSNDPIKSTSQGIPSRSTSST